MSGDLDLGRSQSSSPTVSTSASFSPLEKRSAWAWTLATFFGVGWLKPGPGTWASVATVLLWWTAGQWMPHGPWACAMAAVVVTLIGIPASSVVARQSQNSDPGFVVIDEVAGQLFALIFSPLHWQYMTLSLILFRTFDIWKPGPIRYLESLPGGTGIVLDDVGAGLLAALPVLVVSHFHLFG